VIFSNLVIFLRILVIFEEKPVAAVLKCARRKRSNLQQPLSRQLKLKEKLKYEISPFESCHCFSTKINAKKVSLIG